MKKSSRNTLIVILLAALLFVPSLLASPSNFDLSNLREELERRGLPGRTLVYERIKIEDMWNFLQQVIPTLQEIIIGVVDSGVNQVHPEFESVNLGRTPNRLLSDPELHGTLVMGIIGANNLSATSSANYRFPHMNGIVSGVTSTYVIGLRGLGDGRPGTIGAAFNELIAGQAKTINMSWGFTEGINLTTEEFQRYTLFFQNYFRGHPDILFLKSAGNRDIDVASNTPANVRADNLIVVGATFDINDEKAGFSNFGTNVSLAAPGVNVYGPAAFERGEELGLDNYRDGDGTSFAVPQVTGLAAILKALEPEYKKHNPALILNPKKIKEVIASSSDPINTDETGKPLGKDCFKFNPILHNGCRENAHRASAWLFPPAPSTLFITTTTVSSITLKWELDNFDFFNPDFVKYQLFRATGTNPAPAAFLLASEFFASSTLTFTDTGLSPNTTYSYKLRTVDGAALFSDSNIVSATTPIGLTWTEKCTITNPRAGNYPAMAYDAARANAVFFGGAILPAGSINNETWIWDGFGWTQRFPVTTPPARGSHAMAYDSGREEVVMFGGSSPSGFLSDTWVWDGLNWIQKFPANNPSPRLHVGMAYDAARQQVVLFGGSDGTPTPMGDTWVWNGTTWTQKFPATSPPARSNYRLAYDAAHSEVVLFGGWNGSTVVNDTWVWDGFTWTQKFPTTTPPAPRQDYGFSYDSNRQKVVLFSGIHPFIGPVDDATWEWDGTNWTQVSPFLSPPARGDGAMAYDQARNQVVLFGGVDPTHIFLDTWLLTVDGEAVTCPFKGIILTPPNPIPPATSSTSTMP